MSAEEFYCPSIDVCAICGDSECDGISCIKDLDADSDNGGDVERLEQLQGWVRLGRIQEQANAFLAMVENRFSSKAVHYVAGRAPKPADAVPSPQADWLCDSTFTDDGVTYSCDRLAHHLGRHMNGGVVGWTVSDLAVKTPVRDHHSRTRGRFGDPDPRERDGGSLT